MHTEEIWANLTRVPLKAQLYERETYFRDGLTDAREVLGEQFHSAMQRGALLMIKPDGLAAGKAVRILEFLGDHGFGITAVETLTLGRLQWRELWRFQLTAATQDRLAVNDLVLRHTALLLVLRDEGPCALPATVRLSVLKGPSDVASQSPGCLRRRIGQPNRVFSYFHVADEPADLVRELSILLDVPQRRRVLASLVGHGLSSQDRRQLEAALAESVRLRRELDAVAAIERSWKAVESVGPDRSSRAQAAMLRVRQHLNTMGRGERIAWRPFVLALEEAGLELDNWDLAILGANFIVYDEPGQAKQIVAVEPRRWNPAWPDGISAADDMNDMRTQPAKI